MLVLKVTWKVLLLLALLFLVVFHCSLSFTTIKRDYTELKNKNVNKKLAESHIPVAGIDDDDDSNVKNFIDLNSDLKDLEVYALLGNDECAFTFNVINYDKCSSYLSCDFNVNVSDTSVAFQILKRKGKLNIEMGFNGGELFPVAKIQFSDSLTVTFNKNGSISVDKKLPNLISIPSMGFLQTIKTKYGDALYMKFDGSKLNKAVLKLHFAVPPTCSLDFKIVEGIINTGITTISKEIRTITGVKSTSSNKNNDKTSVKDFREKYSKKLSKVEAKAGMSVKGFGSLSISGSHSSENMEKDGHERTHLQDVTMFIENSLHETKEVKVTYVFPRKTSTIIRQMILKCGEYAVDTGVIMIDQTDLTDKASSGNDPTVIEVDILFVLFVVYLI